MAGIDWTKQRKTLILALQANCHFCNESAPFYRRIAESTKGTDVQLIAAFPTPVESSAAHLKELGLTSLAVTQVPLTSLQTSGTPTLILANDRGEITDYVAREVDTGQGGGGARQDQAPIGVERRTEWRR